MLLTSFSSFPLSEEFVPQMPCAENLSAVCSVCDFLPILRLISAFFSFLICYLMLIPILLFANDVQHGCSQVLRCVC